jgi:hypothetical protein
MSARGCPSIRTSEGSEVVWSASPKVPSWQRLADLRRFAGKSRCVIPAIDFESASENSTLVSDLFKAEIEVDLTVHKHFGAPA